MRVTDIPFVLLREGIRVRSFKDPDKLGTITTVEDIENKQGREPVTWITWDDREMPPSGFFWNDCPCEVVEQMHIQIGDHEVGVINCWWEGPNFMIHDAQNKIMAYNNAWFSQPKSEDDVHEGDISITKMDLKCSPVGEDP